MLCPKSCTAFKIFIASLVASININKFRHIIYTNHHVSLSYSPLSRSRR